MNLYEIKLSFNHSKEESQFVVADSVGHVFDDLCEIGLFDDECCEVIGVVKIVEIDRVLENKIEV